MIVGMIVLIIVNFIALSVTSSRYPSFGSGRIAISFIAPFQEAVTHSIRFARGIWSHYFFLVSAAKENDDLKKLLSRAIEKNNRLREIELSNSRLRSLLNFQKTMTSSILAADGPAIACRIINVLISIALIGILSPELIKAP